MREDDRQKEKEKEKEKEKDGGGLKLPDVPSDPIELPVDVEKNREKQQERRAGLFSGFLFFLSLSLFLLLSIRFFSLFFSL